MTKISLIYKNIFIYRALMNVLYAGKYKARFREIILLLEGLSAGSTVLELCFGDTYIADFCKKRNLKWIGIDLNKNFVSNAQSKRFNAIEGNIFEINPLPKADVCIMIGSLYHFHSQTSEILSRMFNSAPIVMISEPVKNLSDQRGIIGSIARKSTNVGKGEEVFRYKRDSFLKMLDGQSKLLKFKVELIKDLGKDTLVKLIL